MSVKAKKDAVVRGVSALWDLVKKPGPDEALDLYHGAGYAWWDDVDNADKAFKLTNDGGMPGVSLTPSEETARAFANMRSSGQGGAVGQFQVRGNIHPSWTDAIDEADAQGIPVEQYLAGYDGVYIPDYDEVRVFDPSRIAKKEGADLADDAASRMARAAEQGYVTDVYHGTSGNVDSFNKGIKIDSPNLLAGIQSAIPSAATLAKASTAAYLTGQMLAPEDAEAGMRDVALRAVEAPLKSALRTHAGERALERGAREVLSTTAVLTAAEKAAVRAGWEAGGSIGTLKDAMASARNIKARFPTKGTDINWTPFEIKGMEVAADPKTGAVKYSPKISTNKYGFQIDPSTGKQADRGSQYYNNMVDGLANELIATAKAAENGDAAAKRVMDNAGWYKNVEARGFNEYGSFFDTFGDLLGSTSPNTPVKTNFNFSRDILERASRGDFDAQIDQFAGAMDEVDQLEAANRAIEEAARTTKTTTIKAAKSSPEYQANLKRIGDLKGSVDQIRQESGKLYGINSTNAMVALADRWRIFRKGDAPKAKNFSGNLVGYSLAPTIDVWSARNLRRHSGRAPIPSPSEVGVAGEIVDPVLFRNSGEFGFGQDVVTDATKKVNAALGLNLDPRDTQALQWFLEKDYWSKRGWTSVQGEGGSFETMMDALPTESLTVGTSRAQSMEYQGRDFIPGPQDQLEVARRFLGEAATDPDVVAAKAPTTLGLYGSAPETSFDIDIVSNKDAVPVSTLDQVAKQAVEDSQDSFFVARRIKPNVGRARPELFQTGVEAYFTNPVAPDGQEIKEMYDHLQQRGVQGFTLIVDPRKKPGAMADQVIGVRFLDIPQFYDAENFANMSDAAYRQHVLSKQDEYRQIGDELKRTFGNIRTADPAFFDVNVKSKGSAADYVAQLSNAERDPDVLRQEMWGFRPARTRFKEYAGQSQPYYSRSGEGARAAQSGYATPALLGATAAATAGGIAGATALAPDQYRDIPVGSGRPTERPNLSFLAPEMYRQVEETRRVISDFAQRRAPKASFWKQKRDELLELAGAGIGAAVNAGINTVANNPLTSALAFQGGRYLEASQQPVQGVSALTALIASGDLDTAANVARMPQEQIADEAGGLVTDYMSQAGYPKAGALAGTAANVGINMAGF